MSGPFFDGVLWAIAPESAETLLAVYRREMPLTAETLERYAARQHQRAEKARVRDEVMILDVEGPLFKYANLLTKVSGATSYEILARDFQVALDDPAIKGILLNVDSPGGEANGCDELAVAIHQARGRKPIVAYVSGMACSGAYWIASAADRIAVSDAAILGSIGVLLTVEDRSAANERRGIRHHQFVSSVSPGKRPDPASDAGGARIQKMVDDLAAVFVAAVAKHRGVTADTVVKRFGAGGVEIGANAVKAGMADELGSFESALATITGKPVVRTPAKPATATATKPATEVRGQPVKTYTAAERAAIEAEIAAEEKERVAAGWSKAVAAANAGRFGSDPEDEKKPKTGWAKAVADANARIGANKGTM